MSTAGAASSSSDTPWRILVTIHSIYNVPKAALALKGRSTFRVSCISVGNESRAQGSVLPEVTTSFEPGEIVVAADITEVKLDGTAGSGRGSLEWTVAGGGNTCDIVVAVREESAAGSKPITTSQPITIDLKRLVEFKKLTTRVIGTTFGHVGVSFAVAPSDSSGYRRRLEKFLQQYNPQGLEHVSRVVSTTSELDTFTKTYRKYSVVDYEARVHAFFEVYGPDHLAEIKSIMKQWENREEELIRNLVIDNGPELEDVDPTLRLAAFVRQYDVPGVDVAAAVRANATTPEQWTSYMRGLSSQFGPEPDPRKYLFPETYYGEPPASLKSQQSMRKAPTQGGGGSAASQTFPSPTPAASSYGPPSVAPSSHLPSPSQLMQQQQQQQQAASSFQSSPNTNLSVASMPNAPRTASTSVPVAAAAGSAPQQQQQPAATATSSSNVMELWSQLCEQLRVASVPNSELFYLNEPSFAGLLTELRYDAVARSILVAEWQRRVTASTRTEPLHAGDALFDAAKRDTYAVTGMHPLNVAIVSIAAVKNPEHEASFSLRLGECKMRATERLAIVGDYAKLLHIASHGVNPTPQAHRNAPACVFYRRPLHNVTRAAAVCVMLCDVAVGKPFVQPATQAQLTSPKEPTPAFTSEYDSCVFVDLAAGQAIAAYQPQQVLPRFIVHCNVDPSVNPCPSHPTRPVEYFVVEANSFACSQCVVLGQHRGKDVLTVDDAAAQARNALLDLQRDAQAVATEMATVEAELDQKMANLATSETRQAAVRAIEQVRREAEAKVQSIQAELEQHERSQCDSIAEARVSARRVYDDANQVVAVLDAGASHKGHVEAINLAVKLRSNGQVQGLRDKAQQLRTATAGGIDGATGGGVFATSFAGMQGSTRSASMGAPGNVFSQHGLLRSTHQQSQPLDLQHTSNIFAANNSTNLSMQQQQLATTPRNTSSQQQQQQQQQQQPASSSTFARTTPLRTQQQALETDAKLTKEQMTRGWAEFRRGDRQAASKTWADVYERNAQNAMGARARAYISEAIERDYDDAASWYERALSYDPKDTMTLYNYGVLLESVLGKKREAMQLFDAAHQLGDHTAGRRAQQLRQQLA